MLQCLQILGEPINIKTNMSFLLGIVRSTLSYVPWDWYIYLHLVDLYGKCSQIYHTWILWVIVQSNSMHHWRYDSTKSCILHLVVAQWFAWRFAEASPLDVLLVWWFSVLYLACGARSWLNVRWSENDMVMVIDDDDYDNDDHDNLSETWRMMRDTYFRGCERPCLKRFWHSWSWAWLVKIARFEWNQYSTLKESNDLLLGIHTEYCNFQGIVHTCIGDSF